MPPGEREHIRIRRTQPLDKQPLWAIRAAFNSRQDSVSSNQSGRCLQLPLLNTPAYSPCPTSETQHVDHTRRGRTEKETLLWTRTLSTKPNSGSTAHNPRNTLSWPAVNMAGAFSRMRSKLACRAFPTFSL